MFERKNHIENIIDLLSFLKSKVTLSNSLNLTDVNIHSENFYRDLLNLIYGYQLDNINIIEQNTAAIDLGDLDKRVAIQVTSTSSLAKTRKTVNAFVNKKLYEKYDRLIILNIVDKAAHRDSHIGDSATYQLDTKEDIWDIDKLVKDINNFTVDRIGEVHSFLKNEIKYTQNQVLEKEIKTFISLITLLSDESQPSAGNGFIEDPDPDRKIEKRFADHSVFLTKRYQDLYTEYGQVLIDVKSQSDLGHTRIRRLGLRLKDISDRVLNECNGDARKALEELVNRFKIILSNKSIEHDENAIEFFLVDQLICCNVFPNKQDKNG